MIQDLRFGVRMMWKNPGFTLIAALTLALGIGANTAIFSVINSVLIRSLPYPDSERLVNVWEMRPNGGRNGVSGGAFKDWLAHNAKFAHLALIKDVRLNLTGTGTPEHLSGLQVSTEFLSALGVTPLLGRGFVAGEDAIGGNNRVIILAHQLWQRRYGGDAGVIGQTVSLNQIPYTVIGVTPPGALLREEAMFLIPIIVDVDTDTVGWSRGYHCCGVIGRVAPGVTLADAQADLRIVKQRLVAEYPPFKKDWSVLLAPLQDDLTGDVRPTLRVLMATVGLVLLIACANVSNLLLARGNARAREMAIRAALGAHSKRIVRQLLSESLLLAMIGGAAGLLLAAFGVKLLTNMVTGLVPQVMYPELDLNVLAFSVLVACGCGLLFGLLPAIRASKIDLNHALKETERGAVSGSRRRSQSFLVVSEFALTLVLLVGAGLFLRSFVRLLQTDPGFNTQRVLAFDLSFSKTKYPKAGDQQRFLKELNDRIGALPGVEAVGAATTLPLSNRGRGGSVSRTDRPSTDSYGVRDDFVSGDYFSALGIKLLRGRLITEADNLPTAPRVLVIDAKVARDLYPDEDPIGKTLNYNDKPWEIVGVVASIRHAGLNSDPDSRIYGPRAHFSYPTAGMVVRSSQSPASLTERVRKTILEADPDQPIANVRTLEEAVHNSLARQRTTLILLGLFAVVAISLACIGIYGVMSYAIGQRARELSIRLALGAQRREIIRLVLTGGMKPALVGIVIGLGAAFALSRLVEKLLFEVKTHDPLVFIASVCLLALVAVLSIYLPARRAARLDPMAALRSE
ncbi:MAG TPA: ABC transporter permease [Blastocatellia bacterium]|jgi:putative ABC transport system permease protein|nr:ABC transporter permease [Blastocatellia bacterium]